MDMFPLLNSLRIALISTAFTFMLGTLAAYYIVRLPSGIKGVVDCILTLPLVLPPTVVGFFLLKSVSPKSPLGAFLEANFNLRLAMTWYASVLAVIIVTFPLMYRTARSAFESFDRTLFYAGQTLGMKNSAVVFKIMLPCCKKGLVAGAVLAFARGLGEYGATSMVSGYTPGRTATISTAVYQLWREGNDALAYKWVGINILISFAVLVTLNIWESSRKKERGVL